MTVLLAGLVASAVAARGLRRELRDLAPPALVTDVRVLDAKAVTTIEPGADEKGRITAEDRSSNRLMALVWWSTFASLACGLAASVAGGLLGRRSLSRGG